MIKINRQWFWSVLNMLSVIKENKLIQMKICNILAEKIGIYGIKPGKTSSIWKTIMWVFKMGWVYEMGDSLVVKHLLGMWVQFSALREDGGKLYRTIIITGDSRWTWRQINRNGQIWTGGRGRREKGQKGREERGNRQNHSHGQYCF